MYQRIKFILFWNDTLHVSDGLSVHHQEFKTVHTATGICQTETAVRLLASRPDVTEKHELLNMLNYYVYIVNFFFGIISVLTENTVTFSYKEKNQDIL